MSSSKRCPMCRIVSRPEAERCDCGYDFSTNSKSLADMGRNSNRGGIGRRPYILWNLVFVGAYLISALAGLTGITLATIVVSVPFSLVLTAKRLENLGRPPWHMLLLLVPLLNLYLCLELYLRPAKA